MPAPQPRWIREQPARALLDRTNASASTSAAASPHAQQPKRAPPKLALSASPAPSPVARALARRGAAPPASSPHSSGTPRLRQATLPFLRAAGPSAAPAGVRSDGAARSSPAVASASRPAKRPASSPLSSDNEAPSAAADTSVRRRRLHKPGFLADGTPIAAAFGPAPPASLRSKQPLPQDENSDTSSAESSPPRRPTSYQRTGSTSPPRQTPLRRPLQSRAPPGPRTPLNVAAANTSPLKGTTPYMHDTLPDSLRLGWEEHMPSTLAQYRAAAGIGQTREEQAAARERERARNRERAEQERKAALLRLQGKTSSGSARMRTARPSASPSAPQLADACGQQPAEGSGSASTSARSAPRQPRILAYETQPGATQPARKPPVAASRAAVPVFRDSLVLGPTQPELDLAGSSSLRLASPYDIFGGSSPLTSERSDTNHEAAAAEAEPAPLAPPPVEPLDEEESQTAPGGTFSIFQRGSSASVDDAAIHESIVARGGNSAAARRPTQTAAYSPPRRTSAPTQSAAGAAPRVSTAWAQLDQTWLGVEAGQAGASSAPRAGASTGTPLEQAQLAQFGFRHATAPSAQRQARRRTHEPSEVLMRGSRAYLSDDEQEAQDDDTQPLPLDEEVNEETQPLLPAADADEETQPLPPAADADEETQPLPPAANADEETQPLSVASSQTESSSGGDDDVIPDGALAAMEREAARLREPAEPYALLPDMESMDTQAKRWFQSL